MVFRCARVDFRHIVRDRSRFVSDGDERDESGRSGGGDRIADFLFYDDYAVRRTVARLLFDEEKMGDTDSPSFDRVISDPSVKKIVCTPNAEPSGGKFFLYIVTSESGGRRVYILECREELLINILKFVKRGILESDYVMQEKKAPKHA